MASELGELLRGLRKERGLSKQALSDRADVSTTYISQIESGIDPRTRRPFQPSPAVLRRLATALARGERDEARRLYSALLAAAGYLPEAEEPQDWPTPQEPPQAVSAAAGPAYSVDPSMPERTAPTDGDGLAARSWDGAARLEHEPRQPLVVALLDPRLRSGCRAVLAGWRELSEEERITFLTVAELIAARHGWAATRRDETES